MNAQHIFDDTVAHLLAQGRRSVKDGVYGESCAYRGNDGLKCAVGFHIRDDEYQPAMDERALSVDGIFRSGLLPDRLVDFADLLSSLQEAHDECELLPSGEFDLGSLCARLKEVAVDHGLFTSKVPD